MAINIEDLHKLDLTEAGTGEIIELTHPGEQLKELIADMNITPYCLAKLCGVSNTRFSEILNGRRSISADTSRRLGVVFGMSPGYWFNLQNQYDFDFAKCNITCLGMSLT